MKGLVHIVDDDEAVRDSMELLLSSSGYETNAYPSAEAFLAAPRAPGPACVVSDIRMPGIDGVQLLDRLRAEAEPPPVILITGHGDVPLAVQAMKRGASDFLEKPFDAARLIAAIDTALEGARADREAAARLASLSPRERQVMEGLVAGLSNKEIARDYGISPRTVEVYRAHVMTKTGAAGLAELVRLALRAGMKAN